MSTAARKLAPYKGHEVVGVAMKLTNTGDGLSKAMSLAPVELQLGDRVQVVVEAIVVGHDHRPVIANDPHGALRLVCVLKGEAALIVDDAGVTAILDRHKEALDKAKEIPGQQTIGDSLAGGGEATANGGRATKAKKAPAKRAPARKSRSRAGLSAIDGGKKADGDK